MKAFPHKPLLAFTATAALVGGTAAVLVMSSGATTTATTTTARIGAAEKPVAVTVEEVTVRSVQRTVEVVGSLFGLEEASVGARVGGAVVRVAHDVGDVVRPGDLLLEIDPTDARLAIAEARKALELELAKLGLKDVPAASFDVKSLPSVVRAAAKEQLARRTLNRLRQLGSRLAASAEETETAQSNFTDAEASYRQALLDAGTTLATVHLRVAALDSAEQKLKDCRVVVPTPSAPSGRPSDEVEYLVAERLISEGESALPSSALFRLVIARALKLRAFVPERHLAEVKVGQPVVVQVDAHPGETFSAGVARVNPTVDRASRTFQVEILVPNDEHRLSAGCFASAAIQTHLDPKATTVPDESLVQFAGVVKVFAVRDGKAAEVPVRLTGVRLEAGGEGSPRRWVEVTGPLRPGEPVATSGHSKLTDGAVVKLRDDEGRSR